MFNALKSLSALSAAFKAGRVIFSSAGYGVVLFILAEVARLEALYPEPGSGGVKLSALVYSICVKYKGAGQWIVAAKAFAGALVALYNKIQFFRK